MGTLDGLAGLARTSDWGVPGTFILASVDARRAEVYAALYGVPEAGGETELVWGPEVVSCVTLAERFARSRPEDRTVAQGVTTKATISENTIAEDAPMGMGRM